MRFPTALPLFLCHLFNENPLKFAAITLNALAVLVLVWGLTGVASITGSRIPSLRVPVVEVKPLAETSMQEQADTVKALQVLRTLTNRQDARSNASTQSLIALPVSETLSLKNRSLPQRKLTLLVDDTFGYMAMIDGVLVGKGQRLDAGGRVVSINERQVVIAELSGRQTLQLPVTSLRVGTLRTSRARNGDSPALLMRGPGQ